MGLGKWTAWTPSLSTTGRCPAARRRRPDTDPVRVAGLSSPSTGRDRGLDRTSRSMVEAWLGPPPTGLRTLSRQPCKPCISRVKPWPFASRRTRAPRHPNPHLSTRHGVGSGDQRPRVPACPLCRPLAGNVWGTGVGSRLSVMTGAWRANASRPGWSAVAVGSQRRANQQLVRRGGPYALPATFDLVSDYSGLSLQPQTLELVPIHRQCITRRTRPPSGHATVARPSLRSLKLGSYACKVYLSYLFAYHKT